MNNLLSGKWDENSHMAWAKVSNYPNVKMSDNLNNVCCYNSIAMYRDVRQFENSHAVSRCFLDNLGNWAYYRAGDFVVEKPNALTNIKFSLTQIDCTHTKGGHQDVLIVHYEYILDY